MLVRARECVAGAQDPYRQVLTAKGYAYRTE
jgi:hypothetical protein